MSGYGVIGVIDLNVNVICFRVGGGSFFQIFLNLCLGIKDSDGCLSVLLAFSTGAAGCHGKGHNTCHTDDSSFFE